MSNTASRPLEVGPFAANGDTLFVCDSVLPVLVELGHDGAVVTIRTWSLNEKFRGRPTATDVVLTPESIVVGSPAAGGLVRIDRATGNNSFVPLPEDVGTLVADGETIWAVADVDREGAYEAFLASSDRRDVVWEEPSEADMEDYRSRMTGWFGRAPDSDDDWVPLVDPNDPTPDASRWREMEDDEAEHIGPPTPIWVVEGDRVTPVDVGGELTALAVAGDMVCAVVQLPTDPLIKAVQPGGSLSYIRPGTVLIGSQTAFAPIGSVPETGGEIVIDRDRAWLLGFGREQYDETTELRRVDVSTGDVAEPLAVEGEILALAEGRVLTRVRSRRSEALRVSATSDAAVIAELPTLDVDEERKSIDGSKVWFADDDRASLICVDLENLCVTVVDLDVDLSPYLPEPSPPSGFDVAAFEGEQLDALRGAFFGGWQSEDGDQKPFIEGVTFESVELADRFPATSVVAIYRSSDRPGVLFGSRWPLYDDLGNPSEMEYADIGLMENIEAAGYGLPPLEECIPDENGIVWFDVW